MKPENRTETSYDHRMICLSIGKNLKIIIPMTVIFNPSLERKTRATVCAAVCNDLGAVVFSAAINRHLKFEHSPIGFSRAFLKSLKWFLVDSLRFGFSREFSGV